MENKEIKNVHSGHRSRVRKKIQKGAIDTMPEHEILEYLLFHTVPYRDTNELSHKLIDHFGSFHAVMDATYDDLLQLEGITEVTATFLSSLPSIFKRYYDDADNTVKIRDTIDIKNILKTKLSCEKVENMYMICLDSGLNLINCVLIAKGNGREVKIDNRKVMETAIRNNAEYVIVVHNHPDKNKMPSVNDLEATLVIRRILDGVGIKLIDSIIAAGDDYISLSKRQMNRKV